MARYISKRFQIKRVSKGTKHRGTYDMNNEPYSSNAAMSSVTSGVNIRVTL